MLNDTINFKVSEFLCKHCGQGSDIVSQILIDSLQSVRLTLGKPMNVDCGYRCPVHNAAVGGASDSAHLHGLAADVSDPDGALMAWVLANLQLVSSLGFFFEDFRWTPDWVHWQLTRPASGHRIFVPSEHPAPSPSRWNGVYDLSLDS